MKKALLPVVAIAACLSGILLAQDTTGAARPTPSTGSTSGGTSSSGSSMTTSTPTTDMGTTTHKKKTTHKKRTHHKKSSSGMMTPTPTPQ